MQHGIQKQTGISTVQCSSLFLYPSKTSDRASTVLERAYYAVTYWVNRIMGHGSTCTDPWPIWHSSKVTHLTHWSMTHRPIACSADDWRIRIFLEISNTVVLLYGWIWSQQHDHILRNMHSAWPAVAVIQLNPCPKVFFLTASEDFVHSHA